MKKLFLFAIGGLVAFSASAQADAVKKANGMAGKLDKIEEARAVIKEAMANPETAEDAETYFVAGEIEWKAYDKQAAKQAVNPESVNNLEMADQLVNGYDYFMQVFPLDVKPDAKGKNYRFTKKVQKQIKEKIGDFWNAAINYYNADKQYPQAYKAFMIYGDIPGLEELGKEAPVVPDSVRATSYYNAGTVAYTVNANDDAARAFKKARENNYGDSKVYLFEIASWEKIQMADSTRLDEARKNIFEISKDGWEKYGMQQSILLKSMVTALVDEEKITEALDLLNESLEKYPNEAFILGLRGYTYDRTGNDEASEADYRKAAAMDNADFETLRLAASKLLRTGRDKWNEINIGDEDILKEKNDVRNNYFHPAKEIAEKAKKLAGEDQASNDMIDTVLENIDYLLSLR